MELSVRVADTCPSCGGDGKVDLAPGLQTASGESEGPCRRCDQTGVLDPRWIPLSQLGSPAPGSDAS